MDEWYISILFKQLLLFNEKKIVECLILQKPLAILLTKKKDIPPINDLKYSQLIGELKQKKKVLTHFIYKCEVVI